MRVHASALSLSWIPTDSLKGALKTGMDLRLSHWDQVLPYELSGPEQVQELRRDDRFRFGNVVSVWAEVDGDRVVEAGYDVASGVEMGSTSVRVGPVGVSFRAVGLPVLQGVPQVSGGEVRFVQTAGGRTAFPLPRPVPHPPYLRWQAPIVWTTLALTLRADGSSEVELVGASDFPRHWVYDAHGRMTHKSGLADQQHWMDHSFGVRTPWADRDRLALVTEVETELESQLSATVMRGGARPEIRNLPEGTELIRQGDAGEELYLLLDGVVRVEVAGHGQVAEIGPGALLGERALVEGGVRTSTVTAVTPVRVAVAAHGAIDPEKLRVLADSHRREERVDLV